MASRSLRNERRSRFGLVPRVTLIPSINCACASSSAAVFSIAVLGGSGSDSQITRNASIGVRPRTG
jgi:hypothetical protein